MAKNRKKKRQEADEVFSFGPITLARFGKHIIYEANWSEDTFKEFQEKLIEQYPRTVEQIDALVSDIAELVVSLPPEKLLHRAWGEMAVRHIGTKSESQLDIDDAVSMRMLDYVQSIIASVPPAEPQYQELPDKEWGMLREKISTLFTKVNFEYQVCRTAKYRAEDPNFNKNIDRFYFVAQLYWCNVRGKRYPVHEPAYLRQMFLPHSEVLLELFDISGKQFVDEIEKICYALTFGVGDAFISLQELAEDTYREVEKESEATSNFSEQELIQKIVKENEWEGRRDRVFGEALGTDLFDVRKTTALPEKLLAKLAWSPGEETDFFAPGEFCGWPLRIWPIFKRPFIRLNNRYYCFCLHAFLDNIYRVMQRIILQLKPEYKETWNSIQKELAENLPFEYFSQLLPGAKVIKPVFYKGQTSRGNNDWCEADGILIYDDHLFIVEAKGGAFTYTPPATDFPAWIESLKNLVLKPAKQGKRFVEYLESGEKVPIYDENKNQICDLSRTNYRHITICPVTLDPFTEMAAQVQHLHKIGVDVGVKPVWTVSVDDLQVYADVFEDPLIFLHYVEQRMRAFQSDHIQLDDEMDHLGLYLKHNNYSKYAEELQGVGELNRPSQFYGYRSEVDEFFAERMLTPDFPCPLKQDTPARIMEIIQFLSQSTVKGRSEIASYLLDVDSDTRQHISRYIDEELDRQSRIRRPNPLSMHGDVNLTIFCWTTSWAQRDLRLALDHARTVLLANEDPCRLLLELTLTDQGVLENVNWSWIQLQSIPQNELPKLRAEADEFRKKRVAQIKAEKGKIGRNEQCPCGSGKKYKKCCLPSESVLIT